MKCRNAPCCLSVFGNSMLRCAAVWLAGLQCDGKSIMSRDGCTSFYVVCRFSAMHTVTNIFILALALADIAFLVNVPLLIATSILGYWPFGNMYCKIYYSVTTVNQFASSFFLVIMSADRFFAICHPLWSRKIRTTTSAAVLCILVWMIAVVLMYPVYEYSGEISISNATNSISCNIDWPESEVMELNGPSGFALYCFVIGFALPVALMITCYGLVLRRLRSSHAKVALDSAHLHFESPANYRRRLKLRRVTMMIFVVIIVYLLCWTPYWVLQMYIVFSDDLEDSFTIIITCLSLQCLCFANSAINPILYACLSENFKKSYCKAFKRTPRDNKPTKTTPLLVVPDASTIREATGVNSCTRASLQTIPQAQIEVLLKVGAFLTVERNLLVML
ncbi:putative Somatostatin receptor type 1 [Hypsibius exemplaris]|uniref:Somatostatin receptor type 1 n=1 Tax=Hypsibius exemplaris TaxID=2072580 RepID=A0A9X6NL96_HYPEX|nr:putative Somatostatin receptor type 1 [Hypsibius exemplaris]